MLKALQKSFSKSVRHMMMKRANSTASRCSAFYFIQFVQSFIGGGGDVLSSLKPTLHKQHALKTSEDTLGEKKGNVSVREKCSFKQCLERKSEQLYSGCSEGHSKDRLSIFITACRFFIIYNATFQGLEPDCESQAHSILQKTTLVSNRSSKAKLN